MKVKNSTQLLFLSASLSLTLAGPALAGGAGAPRAVKPAGCVNVADWLGKNPQFSTLTAALQNGGYEQDLRSGTYTVFAPTNAAFNKLPSDQLAALLSDQEMLRRTLQNHVVAGKYTSQQLLSLHQAKTLDGHDLKFSGQAAHLKLDNAQVTQANIMACNGVIQVIDRVMVPAMAMHAPAPAPVAVVAPAPVEAAPEPVEAAPEPVETAPVEPAPANAVEDPAPVDTTAPVDITAPVDTTTSDTDTAGADINASSDIATTDTATDTATTDTTATDTTATVSAQSSTVYDLIENDDRFSTLRSLLSDAGLSEELTNANYTLFAPTDEAFDKIDSDQLAKIDADPELLKQILNYHLVKSTLSSDSLKKTQSIDTAGGATLSIVSDGSNDTKIGTAKLLEGKVATNGAMYVIDTVLLPPNFKLPQSQ